MSSQGNTRRADSLQTVQRDGQRRPAPSRPQLHFSFMRDVRKALRWLHHRR